MGLPTRNSHELTIVTIGYLILEPFLEAQRILAVSNLAFLQHFLACLPKHTTMPV